VNTNFALALSVATTGTTIIRTKTPSIFQRAAICPKKDSQVIERLLMMAWLSRITAWKAKTTYLDTRYPPPLLPPVLSRTMT